MFQKKIQIGLLAPKEIPNPHVKGLFQLYISLVKYMQSMFEIVINWVE